MDIRYCKQQSRLFWQEKKVVLCYPPLYLQHLSESYVLELKRTKETQPKYFRAHSHFTTTIPLELIRDAPQSSSPELHNPLISKKCIKGLIQSTCSEQPESIFIDNLERVQEEDKLQRESSASIPLF